MNPVNFLELVKPLRFGTAPAAEKQEPVGLIAKARAGILTRGRKRWLRAIRQADEALHTIPGPGETFHAIQVGLFDLAHMVTALLGKLGSTCECMRIATLSLSAKNVAEMASWLDSGAVKKLDLLCSDFFRKHDKETFAELVQEFRQRSQRVAAARSHCKIITLSLADGRKFTLSGSANLRSNKSQEQWDLAQDPELHGFYDSWIDFMVSTYEVSNDGKPS